jgi:hypothetical protein
MSDNKRPEKLGQYELNPIEKFQVISSKTYDDAIDECRAYYESPEYIQSLIDSGKVGIDEQLVNEFNKFIKEWCGSMYAHLIDSDENDGERFRQLIQSNPIKVVE